LARNTAKQHHASRYNFAYKKRQPPIQSIEGVRQAAGLPPAGAFFHQMTLFRSKPLHILKQYWLAKIKEQTLVWF
jgi:hypothetical protein